MAGKQDFKIRLCRLLHMLNLMSDLEGIRKDGLIRLLGCSERTLERDINLLSEFFTIYRTNDQDGGRRYHFNRWEFNLDHMRIPVSREKLK